MHAIKKPAQISRPASAIRGRHQKQEHCNCTVYRPGWVCKHKSETILGSAVPWSSHPYVHCTTIYNAKTWKQQKSLPTEEWKKKKCYIYTHRHTYNRILATNKKNKTMPFVATWRDLDIVTLSEVRHGKTNIIWYHLYVESYKKGV